MRSFRVADPPLALELVALSRAYHAGVRGCSARARVLDRVSLQLRVGEIVAICGEPGAGKSTLLRCAAGLLRPDEGYVRTPAWPVDADAGRRAPRVLYIDGARVGAASQAWSAVTALALQGGGVLAIDHAQVLGWGQTRRLVCAAAARSCGGAAIVAARDAADVAGIADRALMVVDGRIALDAGAWRAAVRASRRARVGEGAAHVDPPPGEV